MPEPVFFDNAVSPRRSRQNPCSRSVRHWMGAGCCCTGGLCGGWSWTGEANR